MTKKECQIILKVLSRIKDPDAHVKEAIATVEKSIQQFEKMRGQLREQYETDFGF